MLFKTSFLSLLPPAVPTDSIPNTYILGSKGPYAGGMMNPCPLLSHSVGQELAKFTLDPLRSSLRPGLFNSFGAEQGLRRSELLVFPVKLNSNRGMMEEGGLQLAGAGSIGQGMIAGDMDTSGIWKTSSDEPSQSATEPGAKAERTGTSPSGADTNYRVLTSDELLVGQTDQFFSIISKSLEKLGIPVEEGGMVKIDDTFWYPVQAAAAKNFAEFGRIDENGRYYVIEAKTEGGVLTTSVRRDPYAIRDKIERILREKNDPAWNSIYGLFSKGDFLVMPLTDAHALMDMVAESDFPTEFSLQGVLTKNGFLTGIMLDDLRCHPMPYTMILTRHHHPSAGIFTPSDEDLQSFIKSLGLTLMQAVSEEQLIGAGAHKNGMLLHSITSVQGGAVTSLDLKNLEKPEIIISWVSRNAGLGEVISSQSGAIEKYYQSVVDGLTDGYRVNFKVKMVEVGLDAFNTMTGAGLKNINVPMTNEMIINLFMIHFFKIVLESELEAFKKRMAEAGQPIKGGTPISFNFNLGEKFKGSSMESLRPVELITKMFEELRSGRMETKVVPKT